MQCHLGRGPSTGRQEAERKTEDGATRGQTLLQRAMAVHRHLLQVPTQQQGAERPCR